MESGWVAGPDLPLQHRLRIIGISEQIYIRPTLLGLSVATRANPGRFRGAGRGCDLQNKYPGFLTWSQRSGPRSETDYFVESAAAVNPTCRSKSERCWRNFW